MPPCSCGKALRLAGGDCAAMAALPPFKMSKSIKCEAGVAPLPDDSGYAAFVSWQGEPGTRYEESLGLKQKVRADVGNGL